MWVKLAFFGRSPQGAKGVFSTLVFLLVGLHSGAISQAGPISPDALSDLQAWYRVDQGITLSGTQVSGWNDSSTLGRNMAQGTSANRPTLTWNTSYAFPVVRFDGTDDYLAAGDVEVHSNSTGLTVIGVVKPSAVTAGGSSPGLILSKFAASPGNRAWRLGIDLFDVQESPGNSWIANTQLTFPNSADPIAGQWNIVTGSWFPGEAAKGYLVPMSGPNAFQEIYAGAASTVVNQIVDSTVTLKMGTDTGASKPWLSGDLVEVIVYNRALSLSERQGVAQYLQQKYAPQTVQTGPLLVNVNFEGGHNQPLPPGYRIDNGAPSAYHGDGIWSGWRLSDGTPINISSLGRNRNGTASPDERFDTLIHMYNSGGTPYVPYTWQLSVPNGTYWVRAVFGESSVGGSTNHVFVQGTPFTDPDPGIGNDWDEYFGQFTVTDGRVTIAPQFVQGQMEPGVKICFAQVASVFQPQIAINFEGTDGQASNVPLPNYYLKDSGAAFGDQGNGYRYGWVDPATGNPLANPNGRNRNSSVSPDERYDTINHLWNGGTQHYNWEIELPNANYFVLAMFGEPTSSPETTATDNVWIENVRFYDPDPNKGGEWDLFMGVVTVSDGKLTISDIGLAQGAKIAFIEITLVPEPSTWVLGALGGIGLLVLGGYRRLRRIGQS